MGGGLTKNSSNSPIKFQDKYDCGKKLGSGSFADVFLCRPKNPEDGNVNAEFAVKKIKKTHMSRSDLRYLEEEKSIMRRVKHENCVTLFDAFETDKELYLVMELCTGGELFDRILLLGKLSEKAASKIMCDVTEGIRYLHYNNVVHRDLKPENILFADETKDSDLKITDFGLATILRDADSTLTTSCGTPGYCAPEVIMGRPYSKPVDMWSIGVILYTILCGFPPFYADDKETLYYLIKNCLYKYPSPYWDKISDDAKGLIDSLLKYEPNDRLTATELLQHPWMQDKDDKVSDEPLAASVLDGLKALSAQAKWRKANLRMKAISAFEDAGKIHQLTKTFGQKPKKVVSILSNTELSNDIPTLVKDEADSATTSTTTQKGDEEESKKTEDAPPTQMDLKPETTTSNVSVDERNEATSPVPEPTSPAPA